MIMGAESLRNPRVHLAGDSGTSVVEVRSEGGKSPVSQLEAVRHREFSLTHSGAVCFLSVETPFSCSSQISGSSPDAIFWKLRLTSRLQAMCSKS